MSTELKKVKDYTVCELIEIRDYFDCRIPSNEEDPNLNEFQKEAIVERDILDKYILKKWKLIKEQSKA